MSWKKDVARKRQQQSSQIPTEWQVKTTTESRLLNRNLLSQPNVLTSQDIEITESVSAAALLRKLATGELTASAVAKAFCKRAAIAQQLTHCLTEIFFSEALERARVLDEYRDKHGKPIGPLHGLPISLKESFNVKGVQSTAGWVSRIDSEPAESNSALVQLLLDAGAVLYCKTNLPQTSMTADSENNVFGRTLNPHNTSLTAGGSSGGEGALVASRGSILGVGTDIAGSIRIPALCCGVYGFKPTVDRVPYGGQYSGGILEGLPGLKPSAGPLAHTLEDLELFMKTVLNAEPEKYDVTANAVPWSPANCSQEKLRIGIIDEDPDYPLHPPIRRTLNQAISILASAGHVIIHLAPSATRISEAARLGMQYFITGPHPAEYGADHFSGPNAEPPVTSVARAASPFWTGPPPVDTRLDPWFKINELHKARHSLVDGWREQIWLEHNLDFVLGPGSQSTAVAHDTYGFPPYTLLYNVLDYPACIVPWRKASMLEDPEPKVVPGPPLQQPAYCPEEVDGAPCAIQIATRRFHDEKCLFYAGVVDRLLRDHDGRSAEGDGDGLVTTGGSLVGQDGGVNGTY